MLTLLLGASYVRFELQNDYLITFEGECDPHTESCYEGCEDEECTEVYYYNLIERNAAETLALCGTNNIPECDEAWECQNNGEHCVVTYCDSGAESEDTCTRLTEGES